MKSSECAGKSAMAVKPGKSAHADLGSDYHQQCNFHPLVRNFWLHEQFQAGKMRAVELVFNMSSPKIKGLHMAIYEPRWQVGYLYTPADAIAQGLKTLSMNDTRVLSKAITTWFTQLQE
ncbi:hypothetical protein TEA_006475 [Camellia sinensis var. sinensis]|uniref:Uncharacterized protein n=1 Tax=Camellia sinensis var. sinensis TaxID=542762 RepID=A0A4S4F1R0_CAMSN|nr:hypothetical protein TEA_006475 [Camellia sinensis var. sinensis]